jgi:hypothetical protein
MVDRVRRELRTGSGDCGTVEMEVGHSKDEVCVMHSRDFWVNWDEDGCACNNLFYHSHTLRFQI